MPILQIIVLAVVQGFTEFLPISSTAHLYLSSWLLGWQAESLQFDIMLHIGTLLAVVAYFYRDWLDIVSQAFHARRDSQRSFTHDRRLLWWLAIGTIPVAAVGLRFNKLAETTWRNPYLMGVMLIAIGVAMWVADKRGSKSREWSSVGLSDALVVGAAQALAVVPGCSRSGVTISAGLFRGLDREAAARYSFLLSTPAVAGAAAKALWDMHKQHVLHTLLTGQFLIGVTVSAVVGCAVIAWFLQYLRGRSLMLFVYYRVVFGIIVIALAFIRRPA